MLSHFWGLKMDKDWREHLLELINDLDEKLEKQSVAMIQMMLTLEGLKSRASLWGLVAGALPGIGTVLIYLLIKR